jgi:RNA polymerase sigma-70 factor, ECF subfamily
MDRADDIDPFKTFYAANHRRVHQLLARIAGPDEAEDLAQVVFAKAAKALPTFRGDAQSSTWLYRIALHVASDWLRGRSAYEAKVTVQLPEGQDGDGGRTVLVDSQISPEEALARKQTAECIRREIGQLGEGYQAVLILGGLGGLTDEEVAKTLGISPANARVRLHRARAQLRKAIAARCDFYRQELGCAPTSDSCCAPSHPGRPSGSKSAG